MIAPPTIIKKYLTKGPKAKPKEPESGGGKGNAHSIFFRLRTSTPALGLCDNTPLRAVVAAHAAAAVASTPEGATPAVAASAPLRFQISD